MLDIKLLTIGTQLQSKVLGFLTKIISITVNTLGIQVISLSFKTPQVSRFIPMLQLKFLKLGLVISFQTFAFNLSHTTEFPIATIYSQSVLMNF